MCDAAGLQAARRREAANVTATRPLLPADPVTTAMMGDAVDAVAGQSGLTAREAVLQVLVGNMGLWGEWATANMSKLTA